MEKTTARAPLVLPIGRPEAAAPLWVTPASPAAASRAG